LPQPECCPQKETHLRNVFDEEYSQSHPTKLCREPDFDKVEQEPPTLFPTKLVEPREPALRARLLAMTDVDRDVDLVADLNADADG
jgi:hypothetical protein